MSLFPKDLLETYYLNKQQWQYCHMEGPVISTVTPPPVVESFHKNCRQLPEAA